MELILFMNDYKKRIIDDILKEKLESKGAILIEGQNGVVKLLQLNSFQKVFYICQIQE